MPSYNPFKEQAPVVQTGRCYQKHPALEIGEFKVYGGSCLHPVVTDADVYVGLDMSMKRTADMYPWTDRVAFLFYIQDMSTPDDPEQFKKLITWLSGQVSAGKKVHIGCIGGHGRTGMVLSALYFTMTGEADAITLVRQKYCQKAVETQSQVDFLVKHFGMLPAAPVKQPFNYDHYDFGAKPTKKKTTTSKSTKGKAADGLVLPIKSPMSIWGPNMLPVVVEGK